MEEKRKARLFIVRHGQTDWNAEHRIQGSIDRSLDDVGRQQAMTVGENLLKVRFKAIYSSDLIRARQTAEIIGKLHPCPLYCEPALREGNFGKIIEGMTRQEFHSRFSKELNEKQNAPFEERFTFKVVEDSESDADIAARVVPALHTIAKNHLGHNILIVSHGWVMRTLLALIGGFDDRKVIVSNAGVIQLVGDGLTLKLLEHQGVTT